MTYLCLTVLFFVIACILTGVYDMTVEEAFPFIGIVVLVWPVIVLVGILALLAYGFHYIGRRLA